MSWFTRKKQILLASAILLSAVAFFISTYDFGITSSYYVRHDFDNMFQKRMAGDCEAFADNNIIDADKWKQRCIKERDEGDEHTLPVVGWKITEMSINNDQAFLQVELKRDTFTTELKLATGGHKIPAGGYRVNYQMIRKNGHWYLNQALKD